MIRDVKGEEGRRERIGREEKVKRRFEKRRREGEKKEKERKERNKATKAVVRQKLKDNTRDTKITRAYKGYKR